jgi:hypothetical protein
MSLSIRFIVLSHLMHCCCCSCSSDCISSSVKICGTDLKQITDGPNSEETLAKSLLLEENETRTDEAIQSEEQEQQQQCCPLCNMYFLSYMISRILGIECQHHYILLEYHLQAVSVVLVVVDLEVPDQG